MKKLLSVCLLSVCLTPIAGMAQVVVRVPLPPVVIERPVPRPGPRYVWVGGYYRWSGGYYRWSGGRYTWVAGHYVIPPRPTAVWVAPHWVARGSGWIFVSGGWR